jgi:serine/threonine-protein kinase RsbW
MKQNRHDKTRQILGRVKRDEFIGRVAELDRLVSHASLARRTDTAGGFGEARGLLILSTPFGGVSELLRQAFDSLFNRRQEVVPIYFSLPHIETTAVSAAIEFLNTFLLQYLAFRRNEPALCQASLTLSDLVQLAPAADLDWVQKLVEAYNQQRFGDDDRELVRFCLSAPSRVPAGGVRPFVMFDASQLSNYAGSSVPLATELVKALKFSGGPFVLAGMRREILSAVGRAGGDSSALDVMRLEQLADEDARNLVAAAASRQDVSITDETRDLLVQQLEGSPFFITALLQSAREKNLALVSYLACERLYVDELMGGRLNRVFAGVLEHVAPEPDMRASVIRLLCEASPAGPAGNRTASFEGWRKRLNLDGVEVERVLRALHVQELVNRDGETVNVEGASEIWKDYLRSRFRLDALREPRALVVADLMAGALKRAPQTIAHHYRRAAGVRLRELLETFDAQRVPRSLFHYDTFAELYKGTTREEIVARLESDADLMRLPQIFHVASGSSFTPELRPFGEDSSVVAHGFEAGTYAEANEIVWLSAKVESKLEADAPLTAHWCELLESLARRSGFVRTQIWLIANEGFSSGAMELLRERDAYGSSRQQFELLSSRLSEPGPAPTPSPEANEFELILPMGDDNEMLAALTVEQIARRLDFSPEAINQIKTAIVEACINASEHSLSPDRKIYQRFRVENDKLVITISSRGIVPSNLNGNGPKTAASANAADQRRGWGLKLIQTLMDEVEFERVDEGTSLRMTKYLRKSPS